MNRRYNVPLDYQKCEVKNCDQVVHASKYNWHLVKKHSYKFTNASPKMPVPAEVA